MNEWTTVQFPQVPDIDTRKAIIRWVEESVTGKFMPFNRRDYFGRPSFGFEFERQQDATLFRLRWLAEAAAEG